jgi:hypothetical protein
VNRKSYESGGVVGPSHAGSGALFRGSWDFGGERGRGDANLRADSLERNEWDGGTIKRARCMSSGTLCAQPIFDAVAHGKVGHASERTSFIESMTGDPAALPSRKPRRSLSVREFLMHPCSLRNP